MLGRIETAFKAMKSRLGLGLNSLRAHQRMSVEYVSKDAVGTRRHNTLRLSSRVEPEHLEIYAKLDLSATPLGRRLLARKIGSDNSEHQVPARE